MQQVFVIGSSVGIWEKIKSLLLSDNPNDMINANELLDFHSYSETAKDIIIDRLNIDYKGHYFFIENCQIRKHQNKKRVLILDANHSILDH